MTERQHLPSDPKAKWLLRIYFELEILLKEIHPFGGPRVPRVIRLMKKVRERLELWAGS